jgi:hypothetical protein
VDGGGVGGSADPEADAQARDMIDSEAGFTHHLVKPVDPQELRQLLARC